MFEMNEVLMKAEGRLVKSTPGHCWDVNNHTPEPEAKLRLAASR